MARALCSSLSLLLLAASPALADDVAPRGHYIESAIPEHSSAFRSVGDSTTRTFGQVEARMKKTDGNLAKMDLSVALTRGAIEPATHDLWAAKLDERSDGFGYEFKGIQARFDQMSDAYTSAFQEALDRALLALAAETPGEIVACTPKQASALGALAAGGPGGGAVDNGCPGTDFSKEIARRWDSDKVLEERLLTIVSGDLGPLIVGRDKQGEPLEYGGAMSKGWPEISSWDDAEPVLALNGQGPAGESWLHPADLTLDMPALAEVLDRIDELAEESRSQLSEAARALPRSEDGSLLQDEATQAKVGDIQNRARAIRAFVEDSRAAVGAALWEPLAKLRKKGKKAGWSDVGVCVNPPGFGGCEGNDATAEVATVLDGDKKLNERLQALMAGLQAPSGAL